MDRASKLVDVLRDRVAALEQAASGGLAAARAGELPAEPSQLQTMLRGATQELQCVRETGQFLQKVVKQLRSRLRDQEQRALQAAKQAAEAPRYGDVGSAGAAGKNGGAVAA